MLIFRNQLVMYRKRHKTAMWLLRNALIEEQ